MQFGRAPLRVKHTRRAANRAANASGTQSAGCGCSYGYGFRQQLQLSAAAACSTCCRLPVCAALPTAACRDHEAGVARAERRGRAEAGCGLRAVAGGRGRWPVRPTRDTGGGGGWRVVAATASRQPPTFSGFRHTFFFLLQAQHTCIRTRTRTSHQLTPAPARGVRRLTLELREQATV